jgi:L-asparaginase II
MAASIIAEIVRSDFVESTHRVSAVVVGSSGSVDFAAGDLGAPISPRSANKPLQAVGMLDCGLDLPEELLALSAASHSGAPMHLDGVRKILASAGLDETALQTPPALPIDSDVAHAYVRAGGRPSALTQNCSGQHAAMLAVSVANGWSADSYLEPDHPLQLHIAERVANLAGEPIAATLVDGCGLPLFALSLTGVASAYRTLLRAEPRTHERRVADAMRAHPEYVGGAGQLPTKLMRAVPGLLAKGGAEGVFACALPDGRAAAMKVEDGSGRAVGPVAGFLLARVGLRGAEAAAVASITRVPVLGVGREVGEIRIRLGS